MTRLLKGVRKKTTGLSDWFAQACWEIAADSEALVNTSSVAHSRQAGLANGTTDNCTGELHVKHNNLIGENGKRR